MIKIKILSVGKQKHSWLEEAIKEYEKRLTGAVQIEWLLYKSDDQLEANAIQEKRLICLDPRGIEYDSPQFSQFIQKELNQHGPRLTFIIGGALGLCEALKEKANHTISVSKLTFTHQLARLILVEQLYRSLEIAKNSPYHK
ncbi:MAG: 23S rRNA (pseudouridine(1915)-N(3))-methyltransferase RlmH [Rhabdochlamydiaceae bacterium]|nr:23S rRNA (pseudouridine(1915)-N(3))-methyltransferase RlmH [Candidatus Amphrikana amoebophyrae]